MPLSPQGWIYDWYWLETENGTSVTKVIQDGVKIKILGGLYRTFKPETPFIVYVSTPAQQATATCFSCLSFCQHLFLTFSIFFLVCLQFAVTRTDGTPYLGHFNRQISVQVLHEGESTRSVPEQKFIIPDDNIIRLDIMPFPGDRTIKIRVIYCMI